MKIRVLGSGAGGGVPQWNCSCENCLAAREGEIPVRTQASVAVSADGTHWFLLSASPDILVQLARSSDLHPRAERGSPLAGVVLPNGDVDSVAGLFSLRENEPLGVYATRAVWAGLAEANVLWRTLERFEGHSRFVPLELGARIPLRDREGHHTGLAVRAVPVRGKVPLHLEGRAMPSPEDSVGLLIDDLRAGHTLAYFPSVGGMTPELLHELPAADVVFFDGTFWTSDELPARGMARRCAEEMGHWPLSGPEGSLAFLDTLPGRTYLLHVNNTNPLLRRGPAHDALARTRCELAVDGTRIDL